MDKIPCSDMQTNSNYFALCTAIIRQYREDLKDIDFFKELKKNKTNYHININMQDILYLKNFHTTELYELCIDYIEMYTKKITKNKNHNPDKLS